jgi:diguanylate cyclase (GGDEF)-like protein
MPVDLPNAEQSPQWDAPGGEFAGRKILVVEDEPGILKVLRRILNLRGYRVVEATDGSRGIERAAAEKPDLVLLDVMMPGMNGFDVCRSLRENLETAMIPIVMLTVKGRTEDRIRGMECGADDYIIKPFDADELIVRIESALRRKERDLYASPLTRLPGNISIEAELKRRIARREPLAVVALDIDHFKAYNDEYGYQKGDDIISILSMLIVRVVREKGSRNDFVGHIGGDDFLVITRPETVDAVAGEIVARFDVGMPEHYSPEARRRGYIEAMNRHGRKERFPLMSISVVSVTNEHCPIEHPGRVAEILAELKKAAKAQEGSVYLKDRRRTGPGAPGLPVEAPGPEAVEPAGEGSGRP